MSELDEIMEGIHEIKHLYIEGDTLAFETEMNNHTWNLTPRDIEIIIYCLQNENKKLNNIIKEVREFAKLRKEMYERQENVVGQEVIISLLNVLDKGE